jgi:spore coat polysaccharide biosynthesis protein SpsF (cytidylyltransferase family)
MFIIIIQARMGSSRLPGKVLKKLLNKEIILWSYDRCLKSKADRVFIATSTNSENNILEDLFRKNNISFFRGSEDDLLDRYYQLCISNSFDKEDINIIRITSDCPFVDTNMINDMIDFFKINDYDYIINHSKDGIIPEGSGIEIIKFNYLKYLWKNEKDPAFREHATGLLNLTEKYSNVMKKGVYVYKPSGLNVEKVKYIKLSIDTEKDYINSVRISDHFNNYDFTYFNVLKYFDDNN